MSIKTLLTLFMLLTGLFTPAAAQGDDFRYPGLVYRNTGGMTKLDIDFFTLMKRLKDNMPLTPQKIVDTGFELKSSRVKDWGLILTKVNPVQLNDGTILAPIELHASVKTPESDTFFCFSIKVRKFTREEATSNLGKSKLIGFPMGHSNREEFTYRIDAGKYNYHLLFGCTQQEPDVLSGMSFDSSKEPPPPPPTGFYKDSQNSAAP